MTHQHHTLRPAMTAIAAVIALSATPARKARIDNDFMFRSSDSKPSMRPAYQK